MRTVEITRIGNRTIGDQLTEMQHWLQRAGIEGTQLRATRIMAGRVTYQGLFDSAQGADRFVREFADDPA